MKCSTCGSDSDIVGRVVMPERHQILFQRLCTRGHRFMTAEVYPSQLADAREMSCAVRNITRRIQRFQRDMAIAADPRSIKEIAEEFNLTAARVRQIRASMAVFVRKENQSTITP